MKKNKPVNEAAIEITHSCLATFQKYNLELVQAIEVLDAVKLFMVKRIFNLKDMDEAVIVLNKFYEKGAAHEQTSPGINEDRYHSRLARKDETRDSKSPTQAPRSSPDYPNGSD
jgi:hypothetical protein